MHYTPSLLLACSGLSLVVLQGCGAASPAPASADPAKAEAVSAAEATSGAPGAQTPGAPAESASPGDPAQPAATPESDRGVDDYVAIVQGNRDKFRTCYDASLAANPGISGKVVLRWVLNPDGSVKESSVDKAASDIKNDDLERCLSNVLRTLKFPPSKRGMESTVNYPFTFKPGSKSK